MLDAEVANRQITKFLNSDKLFSIAVRIPQSQYSCVCGKNILTTDRVFQLLHTNESKTITFVKYTNLGNPLGIMECIYNGQFYDVNIKSPNDEVLTKRYRA